MKENMSYSNLLGIIIRIRLQFKAGSDNVFM